jgi:hypothetical protein
MKRRARVFGLTAAGSVSTVITMRHAKRALQTILAMSLVLGVFSIMEEARAQTIPDLRYRFHAIDRSGHQTDTLVPLGVPTPVDVTGDALPDVIIDLVGLPGVDAGIVRTQTQGQIIVRRLAPVNALLEFILYTPTEEQPTRRSFFGLDGRISGVPEMLDGSVVIVERGDETGVDATVRISNPGATLELLGGQFSETRREGREIREWPTEVHALFRDHVPATARVAYLPSKTATGGDRNEIRITRDTSTIVTAWGTLAERKVLPPTLGSPSTPAVATEVTTFSGTISRVPRDTTLVLTQESSRDEVHYRSTDLIGSLTFDLGKSTKVERQGQDPFTVVETLAVRAAGIPATPDLSIVKESRSVQERDERGRSRVGKADHITIDTDTTTPLDRPVTSAEFGFAKQGSVVFPSHPATEEYVHALVSPRGRTSVAVRLLGLSTAELDTGNPKLVRISHRESPLNLFVQETYEVAIPLVGTQTHTKTFDGYIRNVPARIDELTYRVPDEIEEAGDTDKIERSQIHYQGSTQINELLLRMTSTNRDDPIVERATWVQVFAQQIPTTLDVAITSSEHGATEDHTAVELKAGNDAVASDRLGLVDVLMTNGPLPVIADADDGAAVWDYAGDPPSPADDFAVKVRLHDLKRISVAQTKSCGAGTQTGATSVRCKQSLVTELTKTAVRDLAVDIRGLGRNGKREYTKARIAKLPQHISLSLETDQEDGTRYNELLGRNVDFTITYLRRTTYKNLGGTEGSGLVTMESNAGNRVRVSTSISKLPASLGMCEGVTGNCQPTNSVLARWDGPALVLGASEPIVVNSFDCKRNEPRSDTCRDFAAIQNLRVQSLRVLQNDNPRGIQELIFDTTFHPLTGLIVEFRDGDIINNFFFPGSNCTSYRPVECFWAGDRYVAFDGETIVENRNLEQVNCPSGTIMEKEVVGPGGIKLTAEIDDMICRGDSPIF